MRPFSNSSTTKVVFQLGRQGCAYNTDELREFQEDAIRVMRGDKMDPKKIWKKHEPLLYSTKQLLEATCEPGEDFYVLF